MNFRRNSPFSLLLILLCWTLDSMAQSHIDLLIIIDEDGTGYTAQHTVFADDELIVSRLPPERNTLATVFSGQANAVYRRAYEQDPNKLSLLSGSVFTRFRHHFSKPQDSDEQSLEETVHRATLDGYGITMADTQSLTSRISWILPSTVELLGYYADDQTTQDPTTRWSQDTRTVTFEQMGALPTQLTLEYRVHEGGQRRGEACLASLGPSEWCSPDIDGDGVPDYRDLCLPDESDQAVTSVAQGTVLSDNTVGMPLSDEGTVRQLHRDALGCDDDTLIVLPQIQFESGQSYLNAQARRTLDKVAVALQRMPDALFRIATHTDHIGYIQNNQTLSENRADAIRHYLMLRGLGPNQIQARGYGETSPAHDNHSPEGRRANRRVELQRLN